MNAFNEDLPLFLKGQTIMKQVDVAIVGGGIVGLATAYQFVQRFPRLNVVVLEKESKLACHQTGHNSGVMHSGIYYKPGSLKSINCRAGKKALEEFCHHEEIPFDICGKVIVAVNGDEISRMEAIYERGQANGVRCEIIGPERLAELEPHAAGVGAIHVPEAGIVDFVRVCERMAEHVKQRDGQIITSARVRKLRSTDEEVRVGTTVGDFSARYTINCAGLHSDRVTRASGIRPDAQIVPFRGEYYELKPNAHHFCKNLIYPVPDPSFPFLGVHFTRMIHGGIECGPNAVLAFSREGYRKRDFNLYDLFESLSYPGFMRLALKYWRTGAGEIWRSLSKAAFVNALQRLLPEIRAEHLIAAPAGVRAQAVSRSGNMVDDFVIQQEERLIHVGNAPSPAATSSLNIGNLIVDKLAAVMK